jgi:hypothetical protein
MVSIPLLGQEQLYSFWYQNNQQLTTNNQKMIPKNGAK